MHFGAPEIILIVLALVLLFGATRLPQLARSIGQSRKAFKDGLREAENDAPVDGPRTIDTSSKASLAAMSDEEILAEMQRRNESRS